MDTQHPHTGRSIFPEFSIIHANSRISMSAYRNNQLFHSENLRKIYSLDMVINYDNIGHIKNG
jgi:hypothetical protein